MDKLKQVLVGNNSSPSEESNFGFQVIDDSSLSWSTRIKGFIICFILGIVLSFIGIGTIFLPNGAARFALFYTIGNILSICSTLFLMGPVKQLKKMFNETRYLATIAMIVFMGLTLTAAFKKKMLLCFIFCGLEFLSMSWYAISYIPFARDAVKKTVFSVI